MLLAKNGRYVNTPNSNIALNKFPKCDNKSMKIMFLHFGNDTIIIR